MTPGTAAALLSLAIALAAGGAWFRRAFAVRLPADRRGFVAAMAASLALAVAAFVLGVGWVGGLLAGVALAASGVFLLLVAISPQKGGPGAFRVGAPLPDFSAPDERGEPVAIASLAGGPLLLKFFRGHW